MKVENKNPKKPLIFYYLIAMVVIMLLNALVFPSLLSTQVTEVGYSDFLNMIDTRAIEEVAMEAEQIVFTAKDAEGKTAVFKTGLWPDDGLVDRLHQSGAKFSAVIPTQASPLLSFLTGWIFPILFFVLIGQLLEGAAPFCERYPDSIPVMPLV